MRLQRIDEALTRLATLVEGAKAVVLGAESLHAQLPGARKALETYVQEQDALGMRGLLRRFVAELVDFKKDTHGETYTYSFSPRGGGREKWAKQFPDETYDWDTPRKSTTWRTPEHNLVQNQQDAYFSIPANTSMAYRGMSMEEWLLTKKRGFIVSEGRHNLGGQTGLTFYGYEPSTGAHYSAGFAPIQHKATRRRPGVVIAVPRSLLLTHKDKPSAIPSEELAHEGQLPVASITGVWFIIPGEYNTGKLSIEVDRWRGNYKATAHWDKPLMSYNYAIVDMTVREGLRA